MAEREVLGDAINVRGVHRSDLAETAAALGVLGLGKVAAARAKAQNLASAGDFKPFSHGFLRFDAFWTSHKSLCIEKERGY
jgi:hypothetical protein